MEYCFKWLWENLKLTTPQLCEVYFCCNCAIVPARVLLNGGELVGNKVVSGSNGSVRCYVRPPLKMWQLVILTLHFIRCKFKNTASFNS